MSAPTSVSHLRIIGYGLFTHYPTILDSVTQYTETVEHILRDYPGLVQREVHVICPSCVKKTMDDNQMHAFPLEDLERFADGERIDCKQCRSRVPLDRLICKGLDSRVRTDPVQSYVQFLEDEVLRLHDQLYGGERVSYEKAVCRILIVPYKVDSTDNDAHHILMQDSVMGTGIYIYIYIHMIIFLFLYLADDNTDVHHTHII